MDFRHTDEQLAWKDTLHRFMEKEVGREYTREHDQDRDFPDEIYAKAAANGWLGMLVPEEFGGVAADPVMYAIFCEAIAKFSLDTAACLMTSMFTISNVVAHGTPDQRAEHIPAFLSGERRFSISISEPEAGSDAANVSTKAEHDGRDWVLNGNKTWCSGAHLPGAWIFMLARTGPDRHGGLSTFLMPNTAEGLDIRKMPTMVRRSLGTTEIFLTDVRVPDSNVVGTIGEGWKYIGEHLDYERLGLAASYVGNARTALDDTIKYTKERIAFGRPLSSLQVLKHRMAEDETSLTAARLLVFNAATKMLRGEKASEEVSMAKVFAAETAFRIATNGMQAYGGYAQLPEYDMERYFREAKHGMVGGGANEIQKTVIARHMGLSGMSQRQWTLPARAFEDFGVGDYIVTNGTVDTADINLFAGLTGDQYPLHVDEMYASGTRFGTRVAHGPLTMCIAVGLVGTSGWYGTCIEALLECRSLKATAPVISGDTLRVRATVSEVEPHKSPKYGVIHVDYDVINQKDESVMTFHWIMLARRRTPLEG